MIKTLIAALLFTSPMAMAQETVSFSSSLELSKENARASFNAFAKELLVSGYSQVLNTLEKVNANIEPHTMKPIRKQVGAFRNLMDIFVYAYEPGEKDLFTELREELDVIYERFGEYKDLYDAIETELSERDEKTGEWTTPDNILELVKYDEEELAKRRKAMLEAKYAFEEKAESFKPVLENIADGVATESRKRKKVKGFFWKFASDEPTDSRNALENLFWLMDDLRAQAANDYAEALELEELTDYEEAEAFHDFRKRMRAVIKLYDFFPELFNLTEKSAERMTQYDLVVDQIGKINDLIMAYHKKDESKKVAKRIDKEWKSFKKWQKKNKIQSQLDKELESDSL